MTGEVRRSQFCAMGTQISVIASLSENPDVFQGEVRRIRDLFERFEQTFSRFREDSELSHVIRTAGRWVEVSETFSSVLAFALERAALTDGLFDPTVLPAMLAAGYDRDFALMATASTRHHGVDAAVGVWPRVEVAGSYVRLPAGVSLDLGGVVKGWAADAAAEGAHALSWVVVNAGGDLRIEGAPDDHVEIGIEDPYDPTFEIVRLHLVSGALATSSVTRRAWGPGLHHLIDPRTARPASTRITQATAWGATCAEAEVAAKWVLLGGLEILERLPAMVVLENGDVVHSLADLEPEAAA